MVKPLTLPNFQIPPNPLLARERLNPAEWTYERLVKQIVEFEKTLSADEEIGGRFVTAPREGIVHIEDLGFWGPDLLIFYGKDIDGRPIQLIQHHSQLSVLLCAVPKEKDTPRRIGFVLEQRLAAEPQGT
jgi:Family of unknown function (DUF6173)